MRPILLSYLKEMSVPINSQTETENNNRKYTETDQMNTIEDRYLSENSCKLVDICARYIFSNIEGIKKMYQDKNTSVWEMIYNSENNDKVLQQCYTTIEYLNKQRKLLRMIEDNEVSLEVFEEDYGNSEVFLRQNHSLNVLEGSLFESSDLLVDAITKFADRC